MTAQNISGRVALVTGASTGIGEALARTLVARGALVGLVARRVETLAALAEELGGPDRAFVAAADVSDPVACRSAVDAIADHFGGLDFAFANAGVSMNGAFVDTELEVFHRMMDVNYFGALHLARFAWPHLRRSSGSLVFVSSVVGKRGIATRSGYSAAKFAVHGLFESLRVEWADTGVHVGLVAPGFTDTGIRASALGPDGSVRVGVGRTTGKVMSAHQAAQGVLDVAIYRRREVVLTAGGQAMVWLNKLAPALADRVAARVVG